MPLYSFRCPVEHAFDMSFPLADVPGGTACPECGQQARRIPTAPRLSIAGTAAFGAVDRAARSAHEPDVVSAPPSRGPRAPQRVTYDPRHQKLPRP